MGIYLHRDFYIYFLHNFSSDFGFLSFYYCQKHARRISKLHAIHTSCLREDCSSPSATLGRWTSSSRHKWNEGVSHHGALYTLLHVHFYRSQLCLAVSIIQSKVKKADRRRRISFNNVFKIPSISSNSQLLKDFTCYI